MVGRTLIGFGAAVAFAANVFVLTQHTKATPVDLAAALDDFRASPVAPAPVESSPSVSARRATGPMHRRQGSAGLQAEGPRPPTSAAVPAPLPLRPDSGVYAYTTSGGERISFGGGRHDYPDRTFAAVRRRAGCRWELEHSILEEHVDHLFYCGRPESLSLLAFRSNIAFFGQTNEATYVCDPPEALVSREKGARSYRCSSEDGEVRGTVTDLERDRLRVGGRRVEAVHVQSQSTLSGRARGTSRAEVWLHPESGLLLKLVREVHSTAAAFGTTVTYDENASFVLESLSPRT
jgi:hypothetical protein